MERNSFNKNKIVNNDLRKIVILFSLIQVATIITIVTVCVKQNKLIEENKRIGEIESVLTGGELAKKGDIPTKISELENDLQLSKNSDKDYITSEEANSLINKKGFVSYNTVAQTNAKLQKQIDELKTMSSSNSPSSSGSSISLDTIKEYVLNTFYPVGSLYYSMDPNFDPASAWGGTWEKLSEGYFVEATQDSSIIATQVAAGLPEIEGKVSWGTGGQGHTELSVAEGAFQKLPSVSATYPSASNSSNNSRGFDFKASRSSSIYGNSTTVQPNAYYAYIWKRVS